MEPRSKPPPKGSEIWTKRAHQNQITVRTRPGGYPLSLLAWSGGARYWSPGPFQRASEPTRAKPESNRAASMGQSVKTNHCQAPDLKHAQTSIGRIEPSGPRPSRQSSAQWSPLACSRGPSIGSLFSRTPCFCIAIGHSGKGYVRAGPWLC
jgi:hypothetical protein